MKPSEAARLLAFVASIEGREVTEMQVASWYGIIQHVPFDVAMTRATRHYETESRRIWPADLLRDKRRIPSNEEWMHR